MCAPWGETSIAMRAKLVGLNFLKDFDDYKDTASLLKKIKSILYEYKGHMNLYLALNDTKIKLYVCYQKPHASKTLHYNTFHALVEVVDHHGGMICIDEALIEI